MTDQLLSIVEDELADDVSRCAAAAGYAVLASTVEHGRRAWSESVAVVMDSAAAQSALEAGWPRRPGVVVVGSGRAPDSAWRAALQLGAENGLVLPDDEHLVVQTLSRLRSPRRGAGAAVAVLGGHGGAGASVFAAAMALRAAHDLTGSVLLVDIDELGGGIDLLLGVEDSVGLRWADLTLDGGQVFADSLHAAVPHAGPALAVLCPRRGDDHRVGVEAVVAVIESARQHGDLVFVDLPRRDDAVVRAVVETVDLVVLLSTATVRGAAATRDAAARWRRVTDRIGLVVRGPAPGGLTAGRIADTVGVPLLAGMRSQADLPAALETGQIPLGRRSALGRAVDEVIDHVVAHAGIVA